MKVVKLHVWSGVLECCHHSVAAEVLQEVLCVLLAYLVGAGHPGCRPLLLVGIVCLEELLQLLEGEVAL